MGIHIKAHQTLKNTERTIKNGQSRDTGNIWYTKQGRRQTKQKHNTICVGHHYAQTTTNNINDKGNNKITELRTIFQRESQNS